jgi:hypothetical protein
MKILLHKPNPRRRKQVSNRRAPKAKDRFLSPRRRRKALVAVSSSRAKRRRRPMIQPRERPRVVAAAKARKEH